MADENIGDPDQPEGDPQPGNKSSHIENPLPPNNDGKRYSDGRILAINLLVLAGYTGLSALTSGGPIIDAFFLLIHVLFCFVAALIYKKWAWGLSALAVLLIGVSTCVGVLWRGM